MHLPDLRLVGVLLSLVVVVVADALSPGIVLLPFVVVPALLAATFASSRVTAWIAGLATLSAIALGVPDHEFATADHLIRTFVVAAVVAFAVYAARVRHAREAMWRRNALYDSLTGLPNRSLLGDRLRQQLHRRVRGLLAVVFVDLDGFKSVNDTLGHAAGDALLRHAAHCLQSVTREADTLARYAGDEFVILCPDLPDASEAAEVAKRVNDALAIPLRIGDRQIAASGSIGIALDDGRERDGDALIRAADEAMFEAKRRREGGYVIRLAPGTHPCDHQERRRFAEAAGGDKPPVRLE